MAENKETEIVRNFLKGILFPISFVLVMWLVFLIQESIGFSYKVHGIIPRKIYGLKGILTSPILHSDWGHILSNTVPFLALSSIIFTMYKRVAYGSFFMILFLTGFSVWIFARPANHIGASGLVYGMVAFVFWSGIFRKNRRAIVLALVVLVTYSGYFVGIVPGKEGVSWESHLLGALSGIITAFMYKNLIEDAEVDVNPWLNKPVPEKEYMFRRDLFDYTMEERRTQRSFMHTQEPPKPKSRPWDVEVEYEEL